MILATSLFSTAAAQQAGVDGTTVDESGHRIANAVVIIKEMGKQAFADVNGRWGFHNLVPGQYTLLVRHIAYAPQERRIVVHEGGDTLTIVLRQALLPGDEVVIQTRRASGSGEAMSYAADVRTADDLGSPSAITIADALVSVPGVTVVRDGTWETAVAIRGFSRSNIIMAIDNVRLETANDIAGVLSLVNPLDLERVETIRSSGTVLFGSGALGGVLHMMTRQPAFGDTAHWGGQWTSAYTSVHQGASHYAAIDRSTEDVAFRVSGGVRRAGDTHTPQGVLPHSQYHDFSLCGSLALRTLGNQSLHCSYQRSQAEDTGIPGGAPIATGASARYTLARRELVSAEYQIPWAASWMPSLTARVSHQEIDRNVEIIQSPVVTVTPHATHATTSAQVESQVAFADHWLAAVGIDVWERRLESLREKHLAAAHQLVGERPVPASRFLSSGMYAHHTWTSSSGQWTITAGARYDAIRISNDQTLNPEYVISGGVLQTAPAGQKVLWQALVAHNHSWNATAGLEYRIAPAVRTAITVATAFRAPSLEERYQFLDLGSSVFLGNPGLLPEQSVNINAETRVSAGATGLQLDLFVNSLTNLVTGVPGTYEGRPATIAANIGRARLYGGEMSVDQLLVSWASVRGTLSYVRGEDLRSHTNLPQIPPMQCSMSLRGIVQGMGNVSFTMEGTATQHDLAPGERQTGGYLVFGVDVQSLPLRVGPSSLLLRAGIDNIFDKLYEDHLSTLRGLVHAEPGRNLFVGLTAAF